MTAEPDAASSALLPFAPSLTVRVLEQAELAAAGELVNQWLAQAHYSTPLSEPALSEQLSGASPVTLAPLNWQFRQLIGAWRAGELISLADVAVCSSRAVNLGTAATPVGLLRFLALSARTDVRDAAAAALLAAAETFWRTNRVGVVKAFVVGAGYPTFQGGIGLLPGDWSDHVRLLTAHGFLFGDRYYCLQRMLGDRLSEESVPQGALSLAFRGSRADRRYQVFFRRTEPIAEARLVQCSAQGAAGLRPYALLAEWHVDERWRNQKVGRWLLRRLINDAVQQGLPELIVHVSPHQSAATNLLGQHGFVELNYRGYVLEKNLLE